MKKIGILAFSEAQNFGAVLQVMALSRYIDRNYGEAEVLRYVPPIIPSMYQRFFSIRTDTMNGFLHSLASDIIYLPLKIRKYKRFQKFKKKYCKLSPYKSKDPLKCGVYDLYIVGSDQIWNLKLTKCDLNFFLPGITKSHRKCSYAASLGVDTLTEEEIAFFRNNLSSFAQISVREQTSKKLLCSSIKDLTIERNIDPVFLQNKSFYEQIMRPRMYRRPYTLVYTFNRDDEAIAIAKESSNNDVVMIGERLRSPDGVKMIRSVGPREFLSLIYHADMVVTDSFHGTAFCILFHKQFGVFPFEGTSSRMRDLLRLFCLEDALINGNVPLRYISFDKVDAIIEEEIGRTKEYFDVFFSSKEAGKA